MENELTVHVLFQSSKKTGAISKTITSLGCAQLKMWALNNTPASKLTLIFERETGNCVGAYEGTKEGFPKIGKKNLGTCEDWGIPLEELHKIKDCRFDGKEN